MKTRYCGTVLVSVGLMLFNISGMAQQGVTELADIGFFNGKVLTVDVHMQRIGVGRIDQLSEILGSTRTDQKGLNIINVMGGLYE